MKKEAEKNQIITQIRKKLKVRINSILIFWKIQEKKSTEESRVAVELRKHYDVMKKKNEALS